MVGFNDKTVLIAGACCPLGQALAHRFADLGAMVIAADSDSAALASLARKNPALIEPLSIALDGPRDLDTLEKVRRDEPIDVLFLLQPVAMTRNSGRAIKSVVMVLNALLSGLYAGDGAVIMVMASSDTTDTPLEQSRFAALSRLGTALSEHVAAPDVRINTLSAAPEHLNAPDKVLLAPLEFLAGRYSVGLNGLVMPVTDAGAAAKPH